MPDEADHGRLHLDDLSVGQRFTSASHAVDAAQIKAFAHEFDPQPFHLDEEAANASLFKGLAASGWHTAAITMRLLVGGGAPIAGGHHRRRRRARLAAPGPPGRRAHGRERGRGNHPLPLPPGPRHGGPA
jgi:acyl dehydratase